MIKKLEPPKSREELKAKWKREEREKKAKINPAFDRMNKADQNAAKATRKRKK